MNGIKVGIKTGVSLARQYPEDSQPRIVQDGWDSKAIFRVAAHTGGLS